ncbi:MAG: hypothetical protein ABW125_07175 [Candidatus Thiodiazotropha lotti]
MAVDATGYFQHLKSYLNMDYYAIDKNIHNELHLNEKIYTPDGEKTISITLHINGDAFAFKLDKLNEQKGHPQKGKHLELFHFLNNEGKPWSRRCDFVIFHLYKRRIYIYCLEYKYKSLPVDSVISQLNSSVDWCRSLYSIINIYTGKRKRLNVTKYVFSYCESSNKYLDGENKYLTRDPSVRHYHYDDVNGIKLNELEHSVPESIG